MKKVSNHDRKKCSACRRIWESHRKSKIYRRSTSEKMSGGESVACNNWKWNRKIYWYKWGRDHGRGGEGCDVPWCPGSLLSDTGTSMVCGTGTSGCGRQESADRSCALLWRWYCSGCCGGWNYCIQSVEKDQSRIWGISGWDSSA